MNAEQIHSAIKEKKIFCLKVLSLMLQYFRNIVTGKDFHIAFFVNLQSKYLWKSGIYASCSCKCENPNAFTFFKLKKYYRQHFCRARSFH